MIIRLYARPLYPYRDVPAPREVTASVYRHGFDPPLSIPKF